MLIRKEKKETTSTENNFFKKSAIDNFKDYIKLWIQWSKWLQSTKMEIYLMPMNFKMVKIIHFMLYIFIAI